MSSCYKTLEQYNSPCPVSFPELGRNCVHSNCPSLNSNSGYYNISNTRGICEGAGCSATNCHLLKNLPKCVPPPLEGLGIKSKVYMN